MDVILKKYVLAKIDKDYIGIKEINDETKKIGLLIENDFRERPIEDLFLGVYCCIKKKDEIIQISFSNDSLYITYYKNDATSYDEFDIVTEEYILYSDLKEDKKFINKINELIEKYEEVKEETIIIFSKKLMDLSLDKFVKENVISFIEGYLKFSLANKINDKELTTIIISYIENHREELLEKLKNMNICNDKLLQSLEGIRDISTILSGLGFLVFGGPLGLILGLLGGFVGATTHYSIKAIKNKKVTRILNAFLQELQNNLNIDECDDQLSLEGVKELEDTKQRVLLEEKIKLQSEENLFDFNNGFKEGNIDIPVYESGPKLKFGYKEE